VYHLSRSQKNPNDTSPVPDITARSEGEQRWVNKLISTVEKLVEEDDNKPDIAKICTVRRRMKDQQQQQNKVVRVLQAKP
jgi:hypothetical protein